MRTAPVRSSLLANAGIDLAGAQRETILICGFLIHQAETMTARGGHGRAKPQSAFNMVLAVRRIHARLGCPMEILPGVRRVLEALVKKFIALHGADAILPKRKEPLDAHRIARMLAVADGTKLGTRTTVDWKTPLFRVVKALTCTGFAAAFRKAELIPASSDTSPNHYLTRASVSWILDGVAVAFPSPEQLAAIKVGDYCVLKPPLLKNDAFGLHFGWKPIWLPVGNATTNAARAIAELILAIPIPIERVSVTPLFCLDSDGTPLYHREADRILAYLLKTAFPEEDCSRWSFHSLRIGAACALLKANASMELIQALCR